MSSDTDAREHVQMQCIKCGWRGQAEIIKRGSLAGPQCGRCQSSFLQQKLLLSCPQPKRKWGPITTQEIS